MDQEPLVREEIDVARKVLDELRKLMPVAAAFWLKADEGPWELYVATDRVKEGLAPVYEVVNRAAEVVDDPNFDPFRVKLIAPRHALRGRPRRSTTVVRRRSRSTFAVVSSVASGPTACISIRRRPRP